jgi:hypothetical protein
MSGVYVAAIWSVAHSAWCEFVVSSDAGKVRDLCNLLTAHTVVHVRVVRVERDDWELIRPALVALDAPPKSYSPKEFEMWSDSLSAFGRDLDAVEDVAPAAPEADKASTVLPYPRRSRGRLM